LSGKNIKDTVTSSREKSADVDSMTNKGGKKGDGGKGKPFSGCFECGGDHYARDCPKANGATHSWQKGGKDKGKGKYKGGKDGGKNYGKKGKSKNWHSSSVESDGWQGDFYADESPSYEAAWDKEIEKKNELEKIKEAGSVDRASNPLCQVTRDLASFRTASGEIIEDEGPGRWEGYTEKGVLAHINGRRAAVHKPLISANKMHQKGTIGIVGAKGGAIILPRFVDWKEDPGAGAEIGCR
jgi:hypothetical protein